MGWSVNRPTGLTFHRHGLSTKGYTLLTPHGDAATYLIDIDGRIVHRWVFSHIKPGYGRLLENGNLLMTGSDINTPKPPKDEPTKAPPPLEHHVTRLGGYHTTLVEVDWDGNVVWEYINKFQHHDFFRFANGNTMVPVWVELPEESEKMVRALERAGGKVRYTLYPKAYHDSWTETYDNPALYDWLLSNRKAEN